MQKFTDVVLDSRGNALEAASVTVTLSGGGAATIYSDNGSTVITQPISTGTLGEFSFYAADGRYDISVTKGTSTSTITDVLLEDSADGSLVRLKNYTVATLPSASTSGAGATLFVTDATATTFASTVAGGGSNKVPVYSDGTNWKIG